MPTSIKISLFFNDDLPHNQHRISTSTTKHVQQFGDERLTMVGGGWDPEILITGHAGKRHVETNMADEEERRMHRRTGRATRGLQPPSPPQVFGNTFFGGSKKNLGKASSSMFLFYYFKEIVLFYFNPLKSAYQRGKSTYIYTRQ